MSTLYISFKNKKSFSIIIFYVANTYVLDVRDTAAKKSISLSWKQVESTVNEQFPNEKFVKLRFCFGGKDAEMWEIKKWQSPIPPQAWKFGKFSGSEAAIWDWNHHHS